MKTNLFFISCRVCWVVLTCLLVGCGAAQKTPYLTPEVKLPSAWQGATGMVAGSVTNHALGFNDPELERLLAEVLRRNNDLAAAAIKVRQARLKAGLKADALSPTASADLSGEYNRDLRARQTDRSHTASGSLSYQVDLWGKLARERDMANWEADATEEDRQSAALSLIGTTVELYFQIAYLNESIALGEESVARAVKTRELARVRHSAGAKSFLEKLEAERALAGQRASQEDLLRQRAIKLTALAILFDGPPQGIVTDPKRLPLGPWPTVEAGLPAELLGRRPDLRATELRLRKSLANVDVERTSYYPTLALTGKLGSSSTALLEMLDHPVATLLASVSLPFLQWNEMQLNVKLAKAEYDQAVVEFRQTLYTALKEVEDSLSARQYYAAQGARLKEALAAATASERMYEARYRSGAESLQVWLDAQKTRQEAEASLLANSLNRLVNHVTLYLALGGEPVVPHNKP